MLDSLAPAEFAVIEVGFKDELPNVVSNTLRTGERCRAVDGESERERERETEIKWRRTQQQDNRRISTPRALCL